ncbi:pacearchaeosortase [archaeon]|jgi:exosortase/archaeosortase family protein|nr:pacearchaeosortase [archaeon]
MEYRQKLFVRFIIAILAVIFYNFLFYEILKPFTIYGSYLFLLIFESGIKLAENSLIVSGHTFNFIHACIAGSAYFLLFILLISTKDIKLIDGIKLFFVGSSLILLMNIIRIDILIISSIKFGKVWFDAIHLIFWKFLSTIYVAFVWISLVKKFKIKTIPIYSDIIYLITRITLKNRKSRRN